MKRLVIWAPLLLFGVFLAVFARGLISPTPSTITSKLVGQQLPDFTLPAGMPGGTGLARADFAAGEPRLLNIFASWCVPCAMEAPQLDQLAKAGVKIEAIAIRDKPEDIARFLDRWGNPYARIASDTDSRVQIAMGSSGVPETFVIDGKGIIRLQHIGPIMPEDVPAILAAVRGAR